MRRYLISIAVISLVLGTAWYFIPYPAELWVRYNVWLRIEALDGFADYVEGQDNFSKATCVGDDVNLDMRPAPPAIKEALQRHCADSKLWWGERTQYGSFFVLGTTTKWPYSYATALIRSQQTDHTPRCVRFTRLEPMHECVFDLNGDWYLHYTNLEFLAEEAQSLAEDVAEELLNDD